MTFDFCISTSQNRLGCPGVFSFEGTDDEKTFRKNLRKKKLKFKSLHYTLNSKGYRCSEFEKIDWENSVVTLGCSQTFGVGLDDTETYSYHLQKLLKMPVINLAQGGSSLWYIVKNVQMLAKLNPKYVVLQIPDRTRFTIFETPDTVHNVGVWSDGSKEQNFYRYLNKHPYNTKVYSDFAIDYIDKLLPNGTTFKFSFKGLEVDKARDLIHSGPKTHRNVAFMIEEYFKLNVL